MDVTRLARLHAPLLLVLFWASAAFIDENKQVSPIECETLLTSVRMEVSPVLYHLICRNNNSTSLVVTCGNNVWHERVTGFCSSFELNIGQTFMDHPLQSSTITLQLIKSGEVLDAAKVAILAADHLFHYRISVWGNRSTRFVLAVVKECSPSQRDASSGTVYSVTQRFPDKSFKDLPIIDAEKLPPSQDYNFLSGLKRSHNTFNTIPEYSRHNVLREYPNVSTGKLPLQLAVQLSKESDYEVYGKANPDETRKLEPYRSKLYKHKRNKNVIEEEYISSQEFGRDDDDSFGNFKTTTPESSEVAKLRWMEEKRILFEEKVKFLRSFYPENVNNRNGEPHYIPLQEPEERGKNKILPVSEPSENYLEDYGNYTDFYDLEDSQKIFSNEIDADTSPVPQTLEMPYKEYKQSNAGDQGEIPNNVIPLAAQTNNITSFDDITTKSNDITPSLEENNNEKLKFSELILPDVIRKQIIDAKLENIHDLSQTAVSMLAQDKFVLPTEQTQKAVLELPIENDKKAPNDSDDHSNLDNFLPTTILNQIVSAANLYTVLTTKNVHWEQNYIHNTQNISTLDGDTLPVTTSSHLPLANHDYAESRHHPSSTSKEKGLISQTDNKPLSENSLNLLKTTQESVQTFPSNSDTRDKVSVASRNYQSTHSLNEDNLSVVSAGASQQPVSEITQNATDSMEGLKNTAVFRELKDSIQISLSTYKAKILPKRKNKLLSNSTMKNFVMHSPKSGLQILLQNVQNSTDSIPKASMMSSIDTVNPDITTSMPVTLSTYNVKHSSKSNLLNKTTIHDLVTNVSESNVSESNADLEVLSVAASSKYRMIHKSKTEDSVFSLSKLDVRDQEKADRSQNSSRALDILQISNISQTPDTSQSLNISRISYSSHTPYSLQSLSAYLNVNSSKVVENHINTQYTGTSTVRSGSVSSEPQIKSNKRHAMQQVETGEVSFESIANSSGTPLLPKVRPVKESDTFQHSVNLLLEPSAATTAKSIETYDRNAEIDPLTSAEDNIPSNATTEVSVETSFPSGPSMTSQVPTNAGTSEASDNNLEEMKEDSFWPIVAALVVGIPAVVVLGITITVIYRKRRMDPVKLFQMRALRSQRNTPIGTPCPETSSTFSRNSSSTPQQRVMGMPCQQTTGARHHQAVGASNKQTKRHSPQSKTVSTLDKPHVITISEPQKQEIPHQPSVDV